MGNFLGKKGKQTKNNVAFGQATPAQVKELSKKFNLSVQTINLLKQKYNMYRGRNNKIDMSSYMVIYREFINANAQDHEIQKSFNGFDADRDNYLDFIELLRAVSLQQGGPITPVVPPPRPPPPPVQPAVIQPVPIPPPPPPQQIVTYHHRPPPPTFERFERPIYDGPVYDGPVMHVVRPYRRPYRSLSPIVYPTRRYVRHYHHEPTIYRRRLRLPIDDYSYSRRLTRSTYIPSPPPTRRRVRKVTVFVPRSRSYHHGSTHHLPLTGTSESSESEYLTKHVSYRPRSRSRSRSRSRTRSITNSFDDIVYSGHVSRRNY